MGGSYTVDRSRTLSRLCNGLGLRSWTKDINTTTRNGRLISHLFGSPAQFERELICKRTQAKLAAARAQGRKVGAPAKT